MWCTVEKGRKQEQKTHTLVAIPGFCIIAPLLTSQETGSRIFLSSSVTATVFPVKERTSDTTDKYITIEPIMIITLRAGVEDLKCL